ncbi:kynureninase [Loktanella sp. Alg231-35]|uniref:kynureninase n=1 Tax=Loktanella sp. Alg231-35 TaxID=1922220 RepID=UPI000D54FED1|nr:kynureninase [Loktanella sp. Alg231-35]
MTDFVATKAMFHLPEGMIYLDGNSLGPLPKATAARVEQSITAEWGEKVITGWNRAGWMAQPTALGDRIGRLIGAEPGHVVLGDTLSIKVYQALAAAIDLVPDRRVILTDNGNFPSDIYMAEGLIKSLGRGYELRVVDPEDVENHINDDLAVLMLTQVDYRTGRLHDMQALTAMAQAAGAVTVWDLAHTAGAMAVDVKGYNADFAIGCTYKYLNGGPGAPAFIYVAPRHIDSCQPALSGWLGHEAPFAFDLDYRPGTGIERMRVGTPPVLQMAALDTSLAIWDQVDMAALRKASIALTEQFIAGIEAQCPMMTLASPRDPAQRGSQVSFHFEHGYAAMQACIAQNVIGDFRAPDIMRFGFTPLFIDAADVDAAVAVISDVMRNRRWDDPTFKQVSRVT